MIQAHIFTSSLLLHYASFRQSGVSTLNCTESRELFLVYAYRYPLLNSGK